MKVTKDIILQKGISLFREKGYDYVSVNEICSACGITKGSFYHHFKAKGDLLNYYFQQMLDHEEVKNYSMEGNETYLEKAWQVFEMGIDFARILERDLMKQLWINDLEEGNKLLSPFRTEERIYFLLKKAQESGECRNNVSIDELYDLYMAAFIGISVNWSFSNVGYDVKKRLRRLFELVFMS